VSRCGDPSQNALAIAVSYRFQVAAVPTRASAAAAPCPILPDRCTSTPDVVPCSQLSCGCGSIDKSVVANWFLRDGSGSGVRLSAMVVTIRSWQSETATDMDVDQFGMPAYSSIKQTRGRLGPNHSTETSDRQ
jgi:hypothetical protein